MAERDDRLDHASILDLVALIYDAAMDSSRWQAFLDRFEHIYPESARVVWYENAADSAVSVVSESGFEPGAMERYAVHYAALNPWTDVMQRKPSGHVHTGEMLVPRPQLERGEFYNDFLLPQNLPGAFGATVLNQGDRRLYFSILLPAGQAYGDRDLELTRKLVPHLQRAAAIHMRFAHLQSRTDSLEALVDRLDVGVFLIAEDGRIAAANRRANAHVESPDGLWARGGALGAWDKREDASLREAIRNALATAAGRREVGGNQLLVTRPSGRRPLSLLVAPIFPRDVNAASPLAGERPAAAIFVADPDTDRSATVSMAARAHGLTGGEASVLSALIAEGSLPRAASQLGIAHETARRHLKTVFSKTGTRNQVELVQLVLTAGPVQVRE